MPKVIPDKAAAEKQRQEEYDAWYCAEVQKGIDDADAGRVISDEQMRKEMDAHLKKLHRKHGLKAA